MYEADGYYFVTVRCFQSRLLLRPSTQMVEVIGGVLARATKIANVELFGFVALSNHVHLLCRARDGELSRFMSHFLGNVSRKAGRLVNWRGNFWERRFSAEQVHDAAALEGRLKYILAQGVKEGLVQRVTDWPGLSCVSQLLAKPKRTFRFYEWARRWKAGRLLPGGAHRWSAEWATDEELELKPLPLWESWSPKRRRARVRQLIKEIQEEASRRYRKVLGVAAVLSRHPHTRPPKAKRAPRPWFHSTEPGAARVLRDKYRAFAAAFKEASEKLRASRPPDFPLFSFAPVVHCTPTPKKCDPKKCLAPSSG